MNARSRPAWTINGRFLTQPATGVQRYAREIVAGLARAGAGTLDLSVVVPAGAASTDGASVGESIGESTVGAGHGGESIGASARGGESAGAGPRAISPGAGRAIPIRRGGAGSGHRWEQLSLPSRVDGGLLCLGNTGPLRVRRQILCIHDANVHTFPASYSLVFRLAYRVLQPMLARRVALLTTVSATSADLLRHHGVAGRTPIEVLPNGHEHVFDWRAERSTLFARQPPRRPYLLLIGSHAPHKNMARVLSLAPALDERGLDVYVSGAAGRIFAAGAGGETGGEAGRDMALGARASNVRWLGFVSDDDLALLYRHALCLVFPSIVEGFGLPLVEAMALGCPVVCSDTSCLPEIAGEAALLADPHRGDEWLDALIRLSESASLRDELIGRGHERARAYSWQASAQGYADAMHRLSG
ncbi:MAG: glycosyltransferase family 1 protein [Burkholderiaceae bacterium]